jgi:hypothetical protein
MLQHARCKQKSWAYTSPDAKHSDHVAWPIAALKDAARDAAEQALGHPGGVQKSLQTKP